MQNSPVFHYTCIEWIQILVVSNLKLKQIPKLCWTSKSDSNTSGIAQVSRRGPSI